MGTNEDKTAGRMGATAKSRADIAIREFKLKLLADMKRSLSAEDTEGTTHQLAVYLVGYVSMDVVVLSAPAIMFDAENRAVTWNAVFAGLGRTDLGSLVLVEHTVDDDGISGKFTGPVTVEVLERKSPIDATVSKKVA